ncbi:MAG: Hsp20/alpha crystallin family protein [Candidatus Pacebacteria bacterium]|nr:Hsp20/alpha crystallin family protein [Candidatus Paceibacterota bacterium]MBP9839478.1 Hsp20/alpha crystallin family protein [Candidatus Paceibacterota bacterium]
MEQKRKRSFFERLTGSIRASDEYEELEEKLEKSDKKEPGGKWMAEEAEEAELAVDVYQTSSEIIIQTMVAGVKPDDLDLTIARNMITIKGKRDDNRTIDEEDYFTKELYWGAFSRTILLPQEVEPEEAEAIEKQGLLTIKLQKIDKEKKTNLKVKSA